MGMIHRSHFDPERAGRLAKVLRAHLGSLGDCGKKLVSVGELSTVLGLLSLVVVQLGFSVPVEFVGVALLVVGFISYFSFRKVTDWASRGWHNIQCFNYISLGVFFLIVSHKSSVLLTDLIVIFFLISSMLKFLFALDIKAITVMWVSLVTSAIIMLTFVYWSLNEHVFDMTVMLSFVAIEIMLKGCLEMLLGYLFLKNKRDNSIH